MKSQSSLILVLLALIAPSLVGSKAAAGQAITGRIVNQSDVCTSSETTAFPGAIFRYRDQRVYYRCSYILGRDAQPAGAAWIPGEVTNSMFYLATTAALGGQCEQPGNLRYSVGAVLRFGGSIYRCTEFVGQDLKPSGVAWVEVDVKENNTFLIKGGR